MFPEISENRALLSGIDEHARRVDLPRGTRVFREGSRCDSLAVVVSGSVRAYQQSPGGRRVVLYGVTAGEACVLTTCCVLRDTPFPACAETDTDTVAVTIPATVFNDWFSRHPFWRDFALGLIATKLHLLLDLLDSVVFQSVDERVAGALVSGRSGPGSAVRLTHAEIADRIGSTRESVSRSIDRFRARGLVRTGRGSIEIVDAAALEAVDGAG